MHTVKGKRAVFGGIFSTEFTSIIFVTAQEQEFRSQEPGVGMRTPAVTFEDLGYGDVSELMQLLEDVRKPLEAYARSILDSGS